MTCITETLSEDTLLLRFGDTIDTATNARVHAAARALREAGLPGVIDIAPAYASLLVRIDLIDPAAGCVFERIAMALTPFTSDAAAVSGKCLPPHPALSPKQETVRGRGFSANHREPFGDPHSCADAGIPRQPSSPPLPQAASPPGGEGWGEGADTSQVMLAGRSIEIPVCYGDEFGPDLETVAAHTGLSRDEVIARHTGTDYTVAMLGFAPGFPYLLGLDPALHVPRRETPRTRVPAGSVAIGGAQTGVYPRELPGGWNLIGRTPLTLFDPRYAPPTLMLPGDRVRFRNIRNDEFEMLREKYRHGWPSVDSRNLGRSQE